VIEKVTEMLYYILQPSAGRPQEEEELPDLPPLVQTVFRSSLSEDQNKAVDLASRLAHHVEAGEHKVEREAEMRDRMRKKVRTIARMARMFKTLRQENETVIRLKGVCPGHRLQPGLLLAGKERLQSELELFGHAQVVDASNEKRPDLELVTTPPSNVPIAKRMELAKDSDDDDA